MDTPAQGVEQRRITGGSACRKAARDARECAATPQSPYLIAHFPCVRWPTSLPRGAVAVAVRRPRALRRRRSLRRCCRRLRHCRRSCRPRSPRRLRCRPQGRRHQRRAARVTWPWMRRCGRPRRARRRPSCRALIRCSRARRSPPRRRPPRSPLRCNPPRRGPSWTSSPSRIPDPRPWSRPSSIPYLFVVSRRDHFARSSALGGLPSLPATHRAPKTVRPSPLRRVRWTYPVRRQHERAPVA